MPLLSSLFGAVAAYQPTGCVSNPLPSLVNNIYAQYVSAPKKAESFSENNVLSMKRMTFLIFLFSDMSEDFRALPSPQTQGVLGSGLEMTCDPPEGVPEPVVRYYHFPRSELSIQVSVAKSQIDTKERDKESEGE